jgi:hypothetical protein
MSEKNAKKDDKKILLDDFIGFIDDIDPKSVKAMIDAGEILTQLKIQENTRYTVKIDGMPSMFKSNFGQTMSLPIEYDNMKWSLIVPKSLKIQLIVGMIRKNLSFETLIGKHLNVIKQKGDTKEFKDAMLYRCEIID